VNNATICFFVGCTSAMIQRDLAWCDDHAQFPFCTREPCSSQAALWQTTGSPVAAENLPEEPAYPFHSPAPSPHPPLWPPKPILNAAGIAHTTQTLPSRPLRELKLCPAESIVRRRSAPVKASAGFTTFLPAEMLGSGSSPVTHLEFTCNSTAVLQHVVNLFAA